MSSKVLVKMPEVPFAQVKKPSNDIVPTVSSNSDLARSVNQLQENIRFLQTKHQQMLASLHDEVDILRQKNRDLQFQLVISKNNSPAQSTSSKIDDESVETKSTPSVDENNTAKDIEAENEANKQRCIQLEKELATTKVALQTSLARTAALQALLQQNKIQEVPWMSQQCGRVANVSEIPRSNSDLSPESEDAGRLQTRLDDAERLVRRLRAETDEQRREVLAVCPQRVTSHGVTNLLFDSSPAPIAARYLQSIKASLSAVGRGNGGGGRGGGNHRPGVMHQRFPPLQSQQAFWQQQGSSQPRENNDYQGWNRGGNRRSNDKSEMGQQVMGPNPGLPDLRGNNPQGFNNGNGNNGQNQSRRGNHGFHYYRNSERGHRTDGRNYRDDEQHKNYNTPAELSEGEVDNGIDNSRNNSYKHKRGHNKHQDKP